MKPRIKKIRNRWECVSHYKGKEQLSVTGDTPLEAFEKWNRTFNGCVKMMDDFMEVFRK